MLIQTLIEEQGAEATARVIGPFPCVPVRVLSESAGI